MAKLVKQEHDPQGRYTLELNPEVMGCLNLYEATYEELPGDLESGFYQPVLEDAEWLFQAVMEACFSAPSGSVEVKHRLQTVVGALADLNLRFQYKR